MASHVIPCIHLFTGIDWRSHVEHKELSLGDTLLPKKAHFEETTAGSTLDWRTAPCEQFVITLSGTLEFITRDGEAFMLRPGDILLGSDTAGAGHRWRLIDDQPWRRLYVELDAPVSA